MRELFLYLFTVFENETKIPSWRINNNRFTPIHAGRKKNLCSEVFAMEENFLPFSSF